MQEKLLAIKEAAFNEISAAENSGALEEIRVKYLGKKGELTTILRSMGALSKEERPVVGKLVNEAKNEVEQRLEEVSRNIKEKEKNAKLASEVIDISLPGKRNVIGKRHPLDLTLESMKEIFPDIVEKTRHEEKGMDFLFKITDDINCASVFLGFNIIIVIPKIIIKNIIFFMFFFIYNLFMISSYLLYHENIVYSIFQQFFQKK